MHERVQRYSALMKNLYIVSLLLLGLGSMAAAQSNNWDVVRGIPAGTTIKVTLKHKPTLGHCILQDVTDEGLACYSRTIGDREFAREDIRAVYVGHNGKLAGLAIGAGIGAVNGAANNPNGLSRGGNALVGALLVGGIGMALGAALGPFFGDAVYRSTDSPPNKTIRPQSLKPAKSAGSDSSRPTLDSTAPEKPARQ